MLSLALVSCSKKDDPASIETSSNKVTIKVPSGAQLDKIKVLSGDYLLASVSAKAGNTVNLELQNMPANQLNKVTDIFDTSLKISDNSAMTSWSNSSYYNISFKGYQSYGSQYDVESCTFYLKNPTTDSEIYYVYSDKNVNIHGSTGSTFDKDIVNLSFNNGWNMVYYTTSQKDTTYYYDVWEGLVTKTINIDYYNTVQSIPSDVGWYVY